jgi:hypothetical protein
MIQLTPTRAIAFSTAILLVGAVPALASADDFNSAPVSTGRIVHAADRAVTTEVQTPEAIAAWEAALMAAKAKRASGRKEHYGGLALAIAGYVVAVSGANLGCERNCSHGGEFVGLAMLGIGTVTGVHGSLVSHDADGEVNALIARGPDKSVPISASIGGGRSVGVSVGATRSLSYRFSW